MRYWLVVFNISYFPYIWDILGWFVVCLLYVCCLTNISHGGCNHQAESNTNATRSVHSVATKVFLSPLQRCFLVAFWMFDADAYSYWRWAPQGSSVGD